MFSACQEEPVFEDQHLMAQNHWAHQNALSFEFEVNPPLEKNLFYTIRHHRDYRYCNLFIRYTLFKANNTSDTLLTRRVERSLYDCQTGRPLGRGVESWYDHELELLPRFSFPEAGTYRIVLSHEMRPDTLQHVHAVGVTLREPVR